MIDDTKEHYLRWQHLLKTNKHFRMFWQFWSNYSPAFFIIAFLLLIGSSIFWDAIGLSITAFLLARWGIVNTINYFVKRQRPYQLYVFNPLTSRFFSWQTDLPNSFPSRHLATLSAIAWLFTILYPPVGWVLIGMTLVNGAARVVLGYHYRTDVITGFVIGLISAYLSLQIWSLFIFT